MRRVTITLGMAVILLAAVSTAVARGHRQGAGTSSLKTVEGVVMSVGTLPGEGGEVNAVRLQVATPEPYEMSIVLAPEKTLREAGFDVQIGDRLRAKVFLSDDEPAPVHKVMNLTRDTMIRLRTLTRVPLWDSNGRWQGGACRTQHGAGGQGGTQHRGGRSH
jgi:hypothetical protein